MKISPVAGSLFHEKTQRTRRVADVHIAQDEPAGHSDETTKVALVVREKGLLRSDGVGRDGGDGVSR